MTYVQHITKFISILPLTLRSLAGKASSLCGLSPKDLHNGKRPEIHSSVLLARIRSQRSRGTQSPVLGSITPTSPLPSGRPSNTSCTTSPTKLSPLGPSMSEQTAICLQELDNLFTSWNSSTPTNLNTNLDKAKGKSRAGGHTKSEGTEKPNAEQLHLPF